MDNKDKKEIVKWMMKVTLLSDKIGSKFQM